MKLYDFLSLEDPFQYQCVWNLGVYIDTMASYNHICQLYAINEFYVEICYNAKDNKVMGKLAFKGGPTLDKYLAKIDLSY